MPLKVPATRQRADPPRPQLRGRIHAAIRTAAEGRQTTYRTTGSTITIGIRGHDAQERIGQLRRALDAFIIKHGLTTRDQPR